MSSTMATSHSFNDKATISTKMKEYAEKWFGNKMKYQTDFFHSVIPTAPDDFKSGYEENKLNEFFTNPKLRTTSGHNCNHLFRSSKDTPHVIVYSTPEYFIIHPLGEPGRDLGISGERASHLMVISHRDDVLTMNDFLPSNQKEYEDLQMRIEISQKAVDALKNNSPVNQCGQKVKEKANSMGLPDTTGVRDFMVKQIMKFDDDFRSLPPGYKLFNSDSNDVASDGAAVKSLVDAVFTNPELKLVKCIQPPNLNTQLLSHIHLFLLSDIPEQILGNYVDIDVIRDIKGGLFSQGALQVGDEVSVAEKNWLEGKSEYLLPKVVCSPQEPEPEPEPEPDPEPDPEPEWPGSPRKESGFCESLKRMNSVCSGGTEVDKDDLTTPLTREVSTPGALSMIR